MSASYDVAVFGPHPDDAEMGMAGTMIKFVEAGFSLVSVCLTRGEMGTHGDVESRRKEFESASGIIGCDCRMLDFPDTGVENNRESRVAIARILRELKPKIIFAPYHANPLAESRGLAHVDHYETGALIRDAVKFARLKKTVPELPPHEVQKLFFYMVPRTIWVNLIVDVSDVIEKVTESIRAYATQMKINFKGEAIDEYVLRRRSAIGTSIGAKYAEAFVTDQPLLMTPQQFTAL